MPKQRMIFKVVVEAVVDPREGDMDNSRLANRRDAQREISSALSDAAFDVVEVKLETEREV